jgi:hypothetical protein
MPYSVNSNRSRTEGLTRREQNFDDEQVLGLHEAAVILRMSSSWLEKSDVPRVKMGRSVRYLKSELLAYAKAHLTHSVTAWQTREAA